MPPTDLLPFAPRGAESDRAPDAPSSSDGPTRPGLVPRPPRPVRPGVVALTVVGLLTAAAGALWPEVAPVLRSLGIA
nr:hypothetical protein [Microthrixaceae bacterium]